MSKQCRGFILLLTLSTIAIISLLLLACMQHVLLYYKTINAHEIQHQNFYQLDHLAMKLAHNKSLTKNKNCESYGNSVNGVINQLVNNEGCLLTIGQVKYRYLIEDLGTFPCIVVLEEGKTKSTHHFRLSLLSVTDKVSSITVLQLRVIRPTILESCPSDLHHVNAGISSWRYFSDYQNLRKSRTS